MAVLSQDWETGIVGTTVSASNPAGGTPISTKSETNGTLAIVSSPVMHGTRALSTPGSAPSGVSVYVRWDGLGGTSTTGFAIRFYFQVTSTANVATQVLAEVDGLVSGTPTQIIVLQYTRGDSPNVPRLQLVLGPTIVKTWTNALAVNTWYRVEVFLAGLGGAVTAKAAYYAGDATTVPSGESAYSSTTASTGTPTTVDRYRVGKIGGSQVATHTYDDVAWNVGATDYIGPPIANTAPIANAGPDQSNIPAGSLVTLDGSASSDPDPGDSIAGYNWSQTGGTTVSLSSTTTANPSFSAPIGSSAQTLTFQLIVTDTHAATSTADTVNIGVLAASGGNPIVEQNFEASANNVAVNTTNNPNAAPKVSAVSVTNSGALVTNTASAYIGTYGMASSQTATTPNANAYARWDTLASNNNIFALRFYFRTDTSPIATQVFAQLEDSTPTQAFVFQTNSLGYLQLIMGSSPTVTKTWNTGTGNTPLAANTWYRIELFTTGIGPSSPTTTSVQADYYLGASGTPVSPGYNNSSVTITGPIDITRLRVGRVTGQIISVFSYDNIAWQTMGSGYIGPAQTVPSANAGPDQFNIIPFTTVTLDGSASTAVAPATIAAYDWTQTGGSTVASPLDQQISTFVAPATSQGSTLQFSLVVTDSNGQKSAPDVVSVQILPHSGYWRTDGGGGIIALKTTVR